MTCSLIDLLVEGLHDRTILHQLQNSSTEAISFQAYRFYVHGRLSPFSEYLESLPLYLCEVVVHVGNKKTEVVYPFTMLL